MPYRVEVEGNAAKSLVRLSRKDQQRIYARMLDLATDPRPAGSEKLKGTDAYRVRQGNYRIVYTVDDAAQVVTVTRIGDRKDVYR